MTIMKSRYVTGEIYAQIIKAKNDMTEKFQNNPVSGNDTIPHRIIDESHTQYNKNEICVEEK